MKKFDWLVFFVGIVFLSAALYRVFNYSMAIDEFSRLGLPLFLVQFMIILEIVLGMLFLAGRWINYASLTAIIFIGIAAIIGIAGNFENLVRNIGEIFVFRANPTDILLHLVYIILLLIIFRKYRKN